MQESVPLEGVLRQSQTQGGAEHVEVEEMARQRDVALRLHGQGKALHVSAIGCIFVS